MESSDTWPSGKTKLGPRSPRSPRSVFRADPKLGRKCFRILMSQTAQIQMLNVSKTASWLTRLINCHEFAAGHRLESDLSWTNLSDRGTVMFVVQREDLRGKVRPSAFHDPKFAEACRRQTQGDLWSTRSNQPGFLKCYMFR